MDGPLLPERRRGSVLRYALNRWQTLVIVLIACVGIAGTIAFIESSPLLILIWMGFGIIGTGAMVVVSFLDAESADEAMSSQLDLGQLRDKRLREKAARAEAYQKATRQALREMRSPALRASLDTITRDMADPVELIFTLAKRLEDYQQDVLIQEDLRRLSAESQELPPAEAEQLATLQKLQRLMQDTEAAIDNALAQLGASYSAVLLARSTGELKGSTATQALADLRQQSQQLRDLNASLDEVYSQRSSRDKPA